jgi:hypothetical protein
MVGGATFVGGAAFASQLPRSAMFFSATNCASP